MDIFLGVMGVMIVILLIVVIVLLLRKNSSSSNETDFKAMQERLIRVEGEVGKINPAIDRNFRENRKEISENLERMQNSNTKSLELLRSGNEKKLEQMRQSNEKSLEEMRETVDEKLKASVEKRFNESFKSISTQLTQVYQGLGEMKNLATGVGDLKKVMEEAGEVALAAKDTQRALDACTAHAHVSPEMQEKLAARCDAEVDHLRYEAADVVYHLLVVLARFGIGIDEFAAELNNRMRDDERPAGAIRLTDEHVQRGK